METGQLIWTANQLTAFYMRATLALTVLSAESTEIYSMNCANNKSTFHLYNVYNKFFL